MNRLFHKDMLRLLEKRRNKQFNNVCILLDDVRKHSNRSYKSVVDGKRPGRAAKSDQEIAASMSRQDAAAYWLARINGDV